MEKIISFEKELKNDQHNSQNGMKLYRLLTTYNAYKILLLKARYEHKKKDVQFSRYYLDDDCYGEQINDLFAEFKNDECLKGEVLSLFSILKRDKDLVFLIRNLLS